MTHRDTWKDMCRSDFRHWNDKTSPCNFSRRMFPLKLFTSTCSCVRQSMMQNECSLLKSDNDSFCYKCNEWASIMLIVMIYGAKITNGSCLVLDLLNGSTHICYKTYTLGYLYCLSSQWKNYLYRYPPLRRAIYNLGYIWTNVSWLEI